jgi:hypothetical protein
MGDLALRWKTRNRIKYIYDRLTKARETNSPLTEEEIYWIIQEANDIDAICKKHGFPQMPKELRESIDKNGLKHWTAKHWNE